VVARVKIDQQPKWVVDHFEPLASIWRLAIFQLQNVHSDHFEPLASIWRLAILAVWLFGRSGAAKL